MPLLSLVSVGMAGQPGAPQQTSRDDQKQSGGNPLSNGIGGLFGKKKKKDDAAQQDDKSGASAQSGTPGSLMDTRTEVTSVSTTAVDASLFQIPAGYKQVETKNVQ